MLARSGATLNPKTSQREALRWELINNGKALKQFGNITVSKASMIKAGSRIKSGMTRTRSLRREHHQHLPAFHARMRLDLGHLGSLLLNSAKYRHAELAVRHFATAEAHGDLHLVAFLEELEHL